MRKNPGKKKRFYFVALATALIFLVGLGGWWLWAVSPASQNDQSSRVFVIKKGEGLNLVAQRLDREGLVKSALAFRLLVLSQEMAGQIQAGDFRLKASLTPKEIANVLTHGVLDVWLTFPEGWRREEYGRRLVANISSLDYPEFLTLTRNSEGFLFPDTYLVPQDASAAAVVKILTDNFANKFNRDLETAAIANGLTQRQVVNLASIVEREAGRDQDRPLVAGILLKRIQNDWPLQADAAVQYAVGSVKCEVKSEKCNWWEPVKKADLEIDSPYNTYLNKGLPPAPICNPGLTSIRAVIYPQESDYWFYLSDPSGQMHYAKTNQEHNANIQKYL